ncbi:MAG: DegT/DnrJ/EryC1/StrS family aminotransferase [Burkholderiales bacterium]|nr:DegT/DnrJ/EryC1/StrS family aminotransferase [Burkholderiales bacterium]
MRIPVAGPWITEKEIAYVTEAASTAWYSKAGTFTARFESSFSEYLGVNHAVSLPSCTSALHLSLLALGVGPGDEVIVPDVTWIASSAPISYVGATPVFADIDPLSWCLAADCFEACITERTKAVIPVDLYGNMPDMDAITAVARAHNVAVIEDAAEAIGSRFKGKLAGSFGEIGAFSFHGSKTLTTGEGGMLVTNDSAIYARVLVLRDHGRRPGDTMFMNGEVAFKYKMSDLQAALGLAQLERIDELVSRKRKIFSWYAEELADVDGLQLNYQSSDTFNTYWMVTVVLDPSYGSKERIIRALRERSIDCRPFFSPLSSLPAYAGHPESARARERNRVSYELGSQGVNLPSALNLDREAVHFVCEQLRNVLDGQRTQ